MIKYKIIGIFLIVITWSVAILSANGIIPYFSEMRFAEGFTITAMLTAIGISLLFFEPKTKNKDGLLNEENDKEINNHKKEG